MPELPEVETIVNAVTKAINNSNIINVIINNNRLREKIPDDFAKKVCNNQILSCKRKAKYMLIYLDNGLVIIWHFGMSGKIKIYDKKPQNTDKHDHVIIETSSCCLVYNDARRFGLLTYCNASELNQHHLFCNIGKDPFDSTLTAQYLYDKLQKKKIAIKPALLDQSIINGIGNIYASEILYLAKISPLRKANMITISECNTIIEKTKIILNQAIKAGGSTIHDYKKPDGSLGYFQNMHCVYNKTGQKCPECSKKNESCSGICKIVQAGRSTFYCPNQQK